ncbi:ATP-dependent DNA ligase [Leifsonia sp. F6_8S_P_1B]|uniref:ATP-dependent DNA ligase n=1 Tax=Leifsonia williamsii TaxID=3035919 RepID=A0ABT8K8D6_9MICO|nr:ATP-dependent DNA ligase [Leifsonia williamsii]MDN4613258.1 ATP-dependent DNA ligase [Leifsonia williamsii]
MGTLTYDSTAIAFDDRLLLHLQIVIVNKLRRRESFAMSWRDAAETGDGRSAIWIDPSIPLFFKYDGSRVPTINREWLALLAESAGSSTGLIVCAEDGSPERAARFFDHERSHRGRTPAPY